MNKWRHQRGKRKRKKGMQEKLRSLESFREWITIWWQANQFVLIINKSWGCRYHAITCLKAHVLVMLVVSIPAHLHLFMEKHEIFHWDIDVTEETEAPNVEISVTDHHWSHERLLCFYSRLTHPYNSSYIDQAQRDCLTFLWENYCFATIFPELQASRHEKSFTIACFSLNYSDNYEFDVNSFRRLTWLLSLSWSSSLK